MVGKRDRSENDSIVALCAIADLDANAFTNGVRGSLTTERASPLVVTEEQLASIRRCEIDDGQAKFQLTIGDPVDVVITVEQDGTIKVAEFAVVWDGPDRPLAYRKAAHRVRVGEQVTGPHDRTQDVVEALRELRRRRRRRYRRCTECEVLTPPEWWFGVADEGDAICQSCANEVTALSSKTQALAQLAVAAGRVTAFPVHRL